MLHESKTVMGIDFDQKMASPFILRLDLANCMFGHTEPEPTDWWALLCLLDSLYNDPVPPSTNQFCWKKNQFRHTPHIVKYQMVSLNNSSFHNALLISTESFLFLRLIWWVTHSILDLVYILLHLKNAVFPFCSLVPKWGTPTWHAASPKVKRSWRLRERLFIRYSSHSTSVVCDLSLSLDWMSS